MFRSGALPRRTRAGSRRSALSTCASRLNRAHAGTQQVRPGQDSFRCLMDPTVCLVSASQQNVFFTELLDALADALVASGVPVERAIDCFPPTAADTAYLFVPHEYMPLTMPQAHPTTEQLRRTVAVCTEQPGTHWFDEDVAVAAAAGAAVDINRLGVAALKQRGVDARLLQLGYVPSWDHWGGDAASERDVDVTFQGGATARRLQTVARCARHLRARRQELHLFDSAVPHRADSEHFLSGARKWELLRRSKLMVNVHRSELGYLEWQRAIGAMVNGCVLLSEHSRGFEPLVPGEHLVSVSYDSLDVAVAALLDAPQQLEDMRRAAYEFLRDEIPLEREIRVLAEAISEVCRRARSGKRARPEPQRAPVPLPRPPATPPTEHERIFSNRGELDIVRMGVKQLLLEQRELRGALRDLEMRSRGRDPDDYVVERIGADARPEPPRVSVVLTVYNYATVVPGAIASVALSDFRDFELVIIDDASTDHSNEAIRAAVAAAPWVSARLVTRAHNRGLARARNLGVELADGELLFILDADNMVYPAALGRLVQALDEHPEAAFAYGIIELFNVNGPCGLTSFLGWERERLRYGNFVDAMAMIRRPVLLGAGGYSLDPRLHGWEDFALWCAIAAQGLGGFRVPEVLARYRVALHSMISLTNIDASAAWSLLVDRFPFLTPAELDDETLGAA